MNNITISTDKDLLQIDVIKNYLINESYWAQNRSLEDIEKTIEHSLCFGMYRDGEQLGFARVVTDYTTMFYLADVFISTKEQNQGLGKHLIKSVLESEELKKLKGFLLTKTAHKFYREFGFEIDDSYIRERLMFKTP